MITVVNFSDKLSQVAETFIHKKYGDGKAQIIDAPVRVDLRKPLSPQIDAVVNGVLAELHGNSQNVDFYISPDIAPVAVLIARRLKTSTMIVMANVRGSVPVQLVPPLETELWRRRIARRDSGPDRKRSGREDGGFNRRR